MDHYSEDLNRLSFTSPLFSTFKKKEIHANYRSNEIIYFRIFILRGAQKIKFK